MATDIKVPAVGESISEGTISRWLKRDGDRVNANEPVFELETDKATTEISSPVAGTLRIAVPEGQTVAVGSVVGRIEDTKGGAKAAQPEASKADGNANLAKPTTAKEAPDKAPPIMKAPLAETPASPSVRRLAAAEGLDLRRVAGSGPSGRITRDDVIHHLEQARPSSAAVSQPPPSGASANPPTSHETRKRMSSIRQRIAERLVAAQQTAAILTTFNEADLSAVMELRSRYKNPFKEKHQVGLGFMSFFVKAAVEALKAFPVVNAWIDGSDIVYHSVYHLGVAVSTEKGLMVPVIRDADRLTFAAIEKRLVELSQKARDGKIAVDDLQGGTFTITNGGVFGSLLSTPILNPPQSAILGMHTIQKRPVAVNDQVVIRPMMYLALSYDHRLIDGREAVQFLVRIKECVENPERLLLEV